MFIPPEDLDQQAVKHVEEEIMLICNTCTDPYSLLLSAQPIWDWSCQVLGKPLSEIRHLIENHEIGETFPTKFLSEKDHLLKLPIVLLEHIHRHA
ncbi:MAG: hypothetical protein G01um101416_1117 [Microgenomates group bacterium Gr01-1014_16]|nr:MAG: hypothetical protein G01um101416_1117 [Microgenomates group bacterium Gr01-1014_16]